MTQLRLTTADDIPFLERQQSDPDAAGEHNWFGYRVVGHLASRLHSGELIGREHGMLTVADDDGRIVGDVSWRLTLNGPPPNGGCWNIGIWLAPEARGKGHGSEAQRLLAEYLFAHTTYERVEASTEAGNLGEQKALEKAGFTREGVLRSACFRAGEWRDMVMYSKLRGE
ncbi:MAG TPA: GNAT family protein [Mycobacteriales bacterium]|nr:GNAT family protein [Mycobacteriales bacterium]